MLLYILGLQLGHIGGNKPTPVSSLNVVLVKTKTLHQFIKYVRCTHRVEPCAKHIMIIKNGIVWKTDQFTCF